jgi:hypothetical protein
MIDNTKLVVVPIGELEQIIRGLISEELTKHYSQQHDDQVAHLDNDKTYLTREEVRDLLDVSLVTLNNWSKNGTLVKRRIGSRVRYHIDDIHKALKQKESLK